MRKILLVIIAAAMLGLGLAVPAMAGTDPPVTATVTVPTSVTITGLTSSISFGSVAPGTTGTVTAAEAYTVSTNDALGYDLTLAESKGTCSATNFGFCSGTNLLDDSNLTVTETGAAPGMLAFNSLSGVATVDKTATNAGNSYSEDWSLAIPAAQAAGTYTETFTYTATAN